MVEIKGGPAARTPALIDRSSGQPFYMQLAKTLCQQINSGVYLPGDQLPSETMLVQTFKVSPMTVRRAVNLLVEQDVVTTIRGRGTFVKPLRLGTAAFYLNHLQEIFSDPSATVKVLEAKFERAGPKVARRLHLEEGAPVIFIRRLLLIAERPAIVHRGYLIYDPRRPIVESELEVTVLKGLFAGAAGQLLKRGELWMEAILLWEKDAAVLQIEAPAAGLLLEHLFYDFEDRPVSWGCFVCQGDELRLHTTIGLNMAGELPNE